MADAELAAAPPAVQESLVEAKLFGKWDFSDVEVRHSAADRPNAVASAVSARIKSSPCNFSQASHMSSVRPHRSLSY